MSQINKPSDYFNTKLYTGDGNTTKAITGVGFECKEDLSKHLAKQTTGILETKE